VQDALFRKKFGRRLNLTAPTTFNEKLHWLMHYYRTPEITKIADKYEVRTHVITRVGSWLLNDLYGVWDDPADLDAAWADLPTCFVLKVTSGSGQNLFCRDKSRFDIDAAKGQLLRWMRRSEYWVNREWSYKNIRPRIVCERLLTDEAGRVPDDYKFFCFDGQPRFVQVSTDRFGDFHRDFFDLEWSPAPFRFAGDVPRGDIHRPENLNAMISVARALSRGFPFVRVDVYSTQGRILFGEMTWYPNGGLKRVVPDEWDLKLGEMLRLPK
jgi:hypothetical protein